MGAVLSQAEAESGLGSATVMSQAEAEAAVAMDAVMSQAEAGAGSIGIGCCDEPG